LRKVLNVGGNSKDIALPPQYANFEHVLLDIDPQGSPDIVCDARELTSLEAGQFDAVYCAHNLEHYYPHEVPKVLGGFMHVLDKEGFAQVRVPDIPAVMRASIEQDLELEDTLYQSTVGPITIRDVIYGHAAEIEQSGQDFYAHKTGFSIKSLYAALLGAGFKRIFCTLGDFEINAVAFKTEPYQASRNLFNVR
jgi:ubiquinone/menaquinone biosynthesis C-methylase UbiE